MIRWIKINQYTVPHPGSDDPVLAYPGHGKDPIDIVPASSVKPFWERGIYTHWSMLNKP